MLATPVFASARTGDPRELELAMHGMRRGSDTVWLGRLTLNVWLHTATHDLGDGNYYPANGALVIDNNEALLIDTGSTQVQKMTILNAWEQVRLPAITKRS